jgi:hypothetical protein
MSRLITIWIDLCLLRAGPQDLPHSRVLLWLTLAAYILVSFLMSVPGYPAGVAVQMALVDLALLLVFATSLLYLTAKTARLNQTLTALAGTGTLLGLIALPLVQLLFKGQESGQLSLLASVFWLLLFGWSLLVVAHIMRHALAVSLPVALGVSILYTLVAMQIIGAIFPLEVT